MRCAPALVLTAAVLRCLALEPHDTLLFAVNLSGDSSGLFYCSRDVPIRQMLSGPVLMGSGRYMLFSVKGYVLYDSTGKVLDSHAAAEEEGGKVGGRPVFACPLDSDEVLYYRSVPPKDGRGLALYQKRLLKKRMREVKDDQYAVLARLTEGALVNIARSSVTDEMARRVYLAPQLVGFSGLEEGDERWWSIDRFYSFSSPLVDERDSALVSFFPGIGSGGREYRDRAIDAAGIYTRDGRRSYVGVSAPMGSETWRSWQMIYFCDDAGNVLRIDSIPKQTNTEIVLGKDSDPEKNVIYTARATGSFVFPPVVDGAGRLFYGTVDYDKKTLSVRRRTYPRYAATPCEPDLAHLFDVEKDISYEPVPIACGRTQATGAAIPRVRFTDAKGNRRAATVRDLTRGGYVARITREVYRDLESKLARGRSGLPRAVTALCDSLGGAVNAACPYAVSVSGSRGVMATLNYPAGEAVLCARVLGVRSTGEVLVRVDLERSAEILVYGLDGVFVDRFTFNRQPCTQRNDAVVVTETSPVIEHDYESDPVRGTYRRWAVPGEVAGAPRALPRQETGSTDTAPPAPDSTETGGE